MIAALLIGREKSSGFPNKNVHPLLGRPLMVYPLMAALNAPSVNSVYVSTDSDKIKGIASKYRAKIIERPPHLCAGDALGEDAFLHGYKYVRDLAKKEGKKIELMVLLFCNAAGVTPETIEQGISTLRQRPEIDSAVTVSRYNMWSPLRARRIEKDGLLHPFVAFETFGDPESLNCDRDSQGDVWFADMGVSIVRPRCLENIKQGFLPQKWMGRKIYPLKQWGGCDIDYEWQVPTLEFWLKKHGFTKNTTPYDR